MTLLARERDFNGIGYQMLLYPATDLSNLERESFRAFAEGFGITLDDVNWFIDQYLVDRGESANPFASPLLAWRFDGLPPAHIVTAGFDVLRDEGRLYAQKLRSGGVAVTEKCYGDLIHGFFSLDGLIDQVRPAIEELAERLRAWFHRPNPIPDV